MAWLAPDNVFPMALVVGPTLGNQNDFRMHLLVFNPFLDKKLILALWAVRPKMRNKAVTRWSVLFPCLPYDCHDFFLSFSCFGYLLIRVFQADLSAL